MPRQTLILDSSQLATFSECDQLWGYQYDESITPKNFPDTNEKMAMGTYGHKLLEIYYTTQAQTKSTELAIELASKFDPDTETCRCGHGVEVHATGTFPLCKKCLVRNKICPHFEAVPFALSEEKRKAVLDRFGIYWMTYSQKDIVPLWDEKGPLVERGFSYPLLDTPEYLFVMEGRIDLIGEYNGQKAFMDHKWQQAKSDLYISAIQFRNYAMVTKLNMGIINYVRLHKEISKDTFVRQPISFTAQGHRQWKEELIENFISIARKKSSGNLEKRRAACGGKWGQVCPYNILCDEPAFTRDAVKEHYYKIKEKWEPW